MSLNQSITKIINESVGLYIKHISETYEIPEDELMSLWSIDAVKSNVKSNVKSKAKPQPEPEPEPDEESDIKGGFSTKQLQKCLRPELQAMCRERGIKSSGTKGALIALLQGGSDEVKPKDLPKSKGSSEPPVLKKILASIPVIAIRRNKWGHPEHSETSFVFDKKKRVFGRQNHEDGTIDDLTKDDINICNKYKFTYVIPSNLDHKTVMDDIKIDELDESDDEESDEEIIEDDLLEEDLLEDEEDEEDDELNCEM